MTSLNSHSITMLREYSLKFSGGAVVKNLYANAGDTVFILGSGKLPGKWNGNPLQYSCLRNPKDRAWWATAHGVAKSQTWLSHRAHTHTHTHTCKTSPEDCFKGVKEKEKSCISTPPHFSQQILILLQNLYQAEEIIFTCVLNTIG